MCDEFTHRVGDLAIAALQQYIDHAAGCKHRQNCEICDKLWEKQEKIVSAWWEVSAMTPEQQLLKDANERMLRALRDVESAHKDLLLARKIVMCGHKRLDGSPIFGDTCLDCGFYLNNGA